MNPKGTPPRTPLIVCGEEISIRGIAEIVTKVTGFEGSLSFDTDGVDGPLRRTADVSEWKTLMPTFELTKFEVGISELVTYIKGL